MREIKFRAWDGENMIYQSGTHSFNIGGHHGTECLTWLGFNMIGSFEVEELMQFTGLTDVNGTEIYEGDVYHQGDSRILYEVVFSEDHSGFVGKQLGSGSLAGLKHFQSAIVIIGNLYENPELLEN